MGLGLHHYLTIYKEKNCKYAESWIQIDLFHWSFCIWKIKKAIPKEDIYVESYRE